MDRPTCAPPNNVVLRKKIKRGGSTVIWKWKWGYKSAPENDFPIEIGNSESAKSCMRAAYAQIRSRNRFPVSGSRFPVRICAPIFISLHLRLIFFLSAGLHFSIRAQVGVGEFQLGLVCVGISGGNLSRPPAQLESAVGPLLYPILQISLVLVSGETVKGTCVTVEEAHPRGGGRVVVTGS